MSRNRLYLLLAVSCVAGYVWLFLNYADTHSGEKASSVNVCIIKHVTNVPCPSCGSTRSVLALLHGHISEALYWNPIGLILALIMIIIPVWLTIDVSIGKETLLNVYKRAEVLLKQRTVAVPATLLIILNWIWNIYKGL